ncbi:MAG: hypothetical protein SNJ64_00600 [Endomicrobiia bacterium]
MKKFFMLFINLVVPCLVFSLSGGSGFFSFGSSVINIDDFNTFLQNKGYSKMSDNFVSFGGGGQAVIDNVIIGGEGHGLTGKEEDIGSGYKASINAGYGFFNIGYVVLDVGNFNIYPLLGIGGGGIDVKIAERSQPSFSDILSNPKRGVEINTGGFLLSISLCTEYLFNLGTSYSANKGGVLLGLRFGYTWSPSYNWMLDGSSIPGSPNVGINGYFVRLTAGFGGFSY